MIKIIYQILPGFRWKDRCRISTPCNGPFFNPEGIGSFSPGLARFREGLPWVGVVKIRNPERVEYQILMNQIQPFQGCDFSVFLPRVARSSQPWAERFNPVGIGKADDNHFQPYFCFNPAWICSKGIPRPGGARASSARRSSSASCSGVRSGSNASSSSPNSVHSFSRISCFSLAESGRMFSIISETLIGLGLTGIRPIAST